MPRKLQPADAESVLNVQVALDYLRMAATRLRAAKAPKALQRVRAAIKSTDGAHRHAVRRRNSSVCACCESSAQTAQGITVGSTETARQLSVGLGDWVCGACAGLDQPKAGTCSYCGECFPSHLADPDINATWQQWECPACGSWNDKE